MVVFPKQGASPRKTRVAEKGPSPGLALPAGPRGGGGCGSGQGAKVQRCPIASHREGRRGAERCPGPRLSQEAKRLEGRAEAPCRVPGAGAGWGRWWCPGAPGAMSPVLRPGCPPAALQGLDAGWVQLSGFLPPSFPSSFQCK